MSVFSGGLWGFQSARQDERILLAELIETFSISSLRPNQLMLGRVQYQSLDSVAK